MGASPHGGATPVPSVEPRVTLVHTGERGNAIRLPLRPEDVWRESLDVTDALCVSEDAHYAFAVEAEGVGQVSGATLLVNGEVVASGARDGGDGRVELDESEVSSPFRLIFGYARAEVHLTCESGDLTFFSQDIPVLVRGSREVEERRVSLMYEDLFGGSADPALEMMLTGVPSGKRRFSIVEGSAISSAPRGLSTFVQMAEKVLAGFEGCLPAFRLHVASKVSRTRRRVPRNRVSHLGTSEVLWIARHPEVLERVPGPSPLSDGRRCFLPRYVETERRARTFDIPENRVVVAFLGQASHRLRALSQMLTSATFEGEGLTRALNFHASEGYVLSSLLVADVSLRMRRRAARELDRLAEWAGRLRGAYHRAAPGVQAVPFKPPRRSKIFQEIDPYGRLYQLMGMWCSFGDVDVSGLSLALRTERMDTFYEYYALHALLRALHDAGLVPDSDVAEPVSTVRYSSSGQYDASGAQVANRYCLSRPGMRAQLFYQPVLTASELEENGVTLHRLTSSGAEAPYTPDFLLRLSCDGEPWRDVVLDAKYMTVGAVGDRVRDWLPSGRRATVLEECLRKYKLECLASDTGCQPASVWLLCGRDHLVREFDFERSGWARANRDRLSPSGAASLSPLANGLPGVLAALGVVSPSGEGEAAPAAAAEAATEVGTAPATASHPAPEPQDANRASLTPGPVATSEPEPVTEPAKSTHRQEPSELEEDIHKLMELMPKKGADLYKAAWAQRVLGMSEPLLRRSVSGKREAKRYRRITLDGKDVFLCKAMLLPQLNALHRYASLLERRASDADNPTGEGS